ncbi:uncharacterized protein [Ptychodera flava]|uniref:uncharacterized protein isoform X2 n=1 Tax=Ptychodera flava TaxID=63121 RepID=UPI00396A6A01
MIRTIYISCPGLVKVNFVERTEWELPRENGRYSELPQWRYLEGPVSVPMKSTYADVVCKDKNENDMHNYHTQFIENSTINVQQLYRLEDTWRKEPAWKPLSVLVITLDSLSRAHAHRKCGLPKTMELLNQLYLGQFTENGKPSRSQYSHQAFLFNRLNALAGSTVKNLTPMFSGEHYDNIDEDKVKKALFAKSIQEWIWQYAAKRGYLTFYGIDNSSGMMGTRTPCKECHYRPPTIPHVEHGWMKHENKEVEANTWAGLCDGNHMLHEYLFNQTREFLQQEHPAKWAAIDLNAGHRAEEESVNQLDKDLAAFIKSLTKENPNLVVILMGDHGKAYQSDLSHLGGYYETLLPFLSLILPAWIFDERPDIMDVLITNQQRYVVHSDLHKTMKSLLHYPYVDSFTGMVAPQAKNLLTDVVARNRSCEEAGLPSWSCVCGHMQKLDSLQWNTEHRDMVEIALKYINDKHRQKSTTQLTKPRAESSCLDLHLQKILHIFVNANPSANSQWSKLYQITFKAVEKDTVWQAVLDDKHDIKQVKQLSLYQPFEVCQDKGVPLQYCVCDHPSLHR